MNYIFGPAMEANIVRKINLPGIYSASGMEVADGRIFVIGDDSPWLYILDEHGNALEKTKLFEWAEDMGSRIPKKQKPDLEAMTLLPVAGTLTLLIIGSGSALTREKAYLVQTEAPYEVSHYSLAQFYNHIRSFPEIGSRGVLNIEGLVHTAGKVVFLQRGNISGANTLISFPVNEFEHFLSHPESFLPVPSFRNYQLPAIEGIPSGFSGAASIPSFPDWVLFTASVEATDNEIDDGEMLGSFIGIIDLNHPDNQPLYCGPVLWEQKAYAGKVESISVWKQTGARSLEVLAVTDADGGDSELLFLSVKW